MERPNDGKRPYAAPKLETFGSVEELTGRRGPKKAIFGPNENNGGQERPFGS